MVNAYYHIVFPDVGDLYRRETRTQWPSELYDSGFEGGATTTSLDLPLLRDPVHLLSSESGSTSDDSESLGFSWIYSTKRLMHSSVQYPVFYLGASRVCYLILWL